MFVPASPRGGCAMRAAILHIPMVAVNSGPAFPQEGKIGPPSFAIDPGSVVRRDAGGKVRWTTRLGGALGTLRPPHLLWDAKRVYVRHHDGVTALSAETGMILWHAQGPNDCLLL